MIRSLKRKFILLTMASLLVLLGVIVVGMNMINYRAVVAEVDDILALLTQNKGTFPEVLPDPQGGFPFGMSPETPYESRFFSVLLDRDGSVVQADTGRIASVDTETAISYASSVLESGKNRGFIGNYRFVRDDDGKLSRIIFLDCGRRLEAYRIFLTTSITMALIGYLIVLIAVAILSGKIIRPIAESYEKQKRFITDAGHELKTPVAVISANADLLSREIGDNRWLANIQYENRRMGTLVGQLLELARTESVTPKTERIDLSRLVQGEALPFESVAFEKGVSLKSDVADGIYVEGNSTQLRQIVSILLDNAIRHSEAHSEAVLALKKEGAHTVLAVSNCGDEIPAEQRERIFERFYRTDTARSGEDGRYGLGLAIAKAIADAHRGTIGVDCRDGIVEFRVRLPLA